MPIAVRVREPRKSKCPIVIVGITVEMTVWETRPTSGWSFFTRKLEKPTKEGKQMTAEIIAGAPTQVEWHAINWQQVHSNVNRLQARIVKAMKENRWGKVKAIQRLLTHSFSGKALAVRRVTENQGKNTPGVDKIIWNTPEKKAQAILDLRQCHYQSKPLKRIYIPKGDGKLRPLSIPCMSDKAIQALYLLALDPIAETKADPNSYGFRKDRSVADAIAQCFLCLSKKTSAKWVLEGDIRSCFCEISHQWMLNNIPLEKRILGQWLQAGYVENRHLFPTESGIPQGGIISPTLMNLTLNGLETKLTSQFGNTGKERRKNKVHLIRFADDFIITGVSKQLLEQEVKPVVESFLEERGLTLSPTKTHITQIEEGFDFLGKHIQKRGGKTFIKPSLKNVKAFLLKIKTVLRENLHTNPGQLLLKINPMIRGWANFHQHTVSSRTFKYVDNRITQMIWKWISRRHPTKNKTWKQKKYYVTRGSRRWVFEGKFIGKEGLAQPIRLTKTADTPIVRHVKIKGEANPYDPEWESYFETRIGFQMMKHLKGRKKLLLLWLAQDGNCLICQQRITKGTGWHLHHLRRKVDGGKNTFENTVLLHPNCHCQVHSQALEVSKPRPVKRAFRKA